ncbi:MAG: hypothetical protein M3552_02305 [Planctomycetota bacterium]|nr:hypothetical protein [Planctomycetaceae bacterium]MDQ3329479.1 hypothetical protein [Planctomycetota bacterium]
MPGISENQVPLAAEDRFLIVSIKEALTLCPGANDAAALGDALSIAKPFLGDLIPLFDLRGLPRVYSDVEHFIEGVAGAGSHILVNSKTAEQLDLDYLVRRRGFNVLNVRGHSYKAQSFDLSTVTGDDATDPQDDPFRQLSDTIAGEFNFTKDPVPVDELRNNPVAYTPPTLDEMQRALTPSRLTELIEWHFPTRILGFA